MKYSEEEIKRELQEFRLPWISRIWKKYGVPALRLLPCYSMSSIESDVCSWCYFRFFIFPHI